MKRVCVFCGAAPGTNPEFVRATAKLGTLLAEKGMSVIFGGGRVGLMGVLADSALRAGGEVIGVIPSYLKTEEIAHSGVSTLHIVDSLAERKQKMFDLSDAFVALPGGLGTLDEMFEILTWYQLGFHKHPMGFLNTEGFYDKLMEFLDVAAENKFLRVAHRRDFLMANRPEELVDRLSKPEGTEEFPKPKIAMPGDPLQP